MESLRFFAHNPASANETIIIRDPAPEQVMLANEVLAVMSPTLEKYGFARHSVSIVKNVSWIVFNRNAQYIAISSSTLPVDFPYYYEVILGEAGPGQYDRQNRQSVTTAQLACTAGAAADNIAQVFPGNQSPGATVDINEEALRTCIVAAKEDLLQYGLGFLEGDTNLFRQAVKQWNKNASL